MTIYKISKNHPQKFPQNQHAVWFKQDIVAENFLSLNMILAWAVYNLLMATMLSFEGNLKTFCWSQEPFITGFIACSFVVVV